MSNLVIVESPSKINKIAKILGNDFKVMASLGHIRDLPKASLGIDKKNNYQAVYEITKHKVVSDIKKAVKTSKTVYIATDPDREGEGIAWHLTEVLKLSYPKARRMTFNEITKEAVQLALHNANENGKMDINAVNSYKARRFADKITGFTISPLLWKNVYGAKSAGRVQSVATKLITDREQEIINHIPEIKFLVSGIFLEKNNEPISATLNKILETDDEDALVKSNNLLDVCKNSSFSTSGKKKKNISHSPQPAFKTSVFQQEAGKRYGISPKDSMRIAQSLYEKGKITYHRTDITRLSNYFKNEAKEYITKKYGSNYLSSEFEEENPDVKTGKNNEQAAHEAIRPTDVNTLFLDENFSKQENLLYKMIWTRAVSSLMAKEKCERHIVTIDISGTDKYWFEASHTVVLFDGFKILGNNNNEQKDINKIVLELEEKQKLKYESIQSKQTYTKPLGRYTESSLVKELENKGIGRPSTYANIISTIQQRKYVVKKKSETTKKNCQIYTLANGEITEKQTEMELGDKKQRLFPSDLGEKVTNFLTENVSCIMDYKFTSNLETELDEISKGKKNWIQTVDTLNNTLEKIVSDIKKKPHVKKSFNDRVIGKYENSSIEYFMGKNGPFIKHKGKCYSILEKYDDISKVTIEIAVKSMNTSIFSFECEINGKPGKIMGENGKYGNYLKFSPDKGNKSFNYFLPKELKNNNESFSKMTLEDCLKQVEFVSKYRNNKKNN